MRQRRPVLIELRLRRERRTAAREDGRPAARKHDDASRTARPLDIIPNHESSVACVSVATTIAPRLGVSWLTRSSRGNRRQVRHRI